MKMEHGFDCIRDGQTLVREEVSPVTRRQLGWIIAGPTARKKTTKKFSEFDAELDETICDRFTNARLTITLKLGFRQVNPARGAATGTYHDYGDRRETARQIVRWDPGAWALWKSNFQRTAEQFWDRKFWLINNFPVLEFSDGGVMYRHNVECRFNLVGADASRGSVHHHTIDVVRLDPSETFFGSHSTLYDNLDITEIQKGTTSGGTPIMQRAHVHEVGHLLGLGHSAEGTSACPVSGNTNASACYGTSDHEKTSVMGQGMDLRPEHAYPWRMAIADMLGSGTVRKPSVNRGLARQQNAIRVAAGLAGNLTGPDVATSDWTSVMRRHFPRTLAEARAGARIRTRPDR